MDVSYLIALFIFFIYFPIYYLFLLAKPSYLSPVNPVGSITALFSQSLSIALWFWGGIIVLGIFLIVFIGTGLLEKLVRDHYRKKPSFDESRYLKVKRFLSFICLLLLFAGIFASNVYNNIQNNKASKDSYAQGAADEAKKFFSQQDLWQNSQDYFAYNSDGLNDESTSLYASSMLRSRWWLTTIQNQYDTNVGNGNSNGESFNQYQQNMNNYARHSD